MSNTNATSEATSSNEDPKYLSMLEQMGLKASQVPTDLRESIYQKMGMSQPGSKTTPSQKTKVKRQQEQKQIKEAEKSEGELLGALDQGAIGQENLSMSTLFGALSSKTTNTTKVRQQLTKMAKEKVGSVKLDAPVASRHKIQKERAVNYEINQRNLGRYIPQVKANREEVQHDFTTNEKLQHGGGVALNSAKQIAANHQEPGSELEKQIHAELKKQGLSTEKDIVRKEMENLPSGVTVEQMKARYDEVARMKHLLFKQEIKNRRVSKIKSKLYHKLKRKDAERESSKLQTYLAEIDPEAAKAYKEKAELMKVEERLRARHGTDTQYAKNLKRFRNMDDKQTRDAYHQTVLDRQALTQRKEKVDENESSSEESYDEEEGEDVVEGAIKRIKDEINSSDEEQGDSDSDENSEDGNEDESDGSQADVIKMNFKDKKESKSKKADDKGITGLKFMKRAEQREKDALKSQAEIAIEQMGNGQSSLLSASNTESIFGKASAKFGAQSLEVPNLIDSLKNPANKVDDSKLMRALRNEGADKNSDDESEIVQKSTPGKSQQKSKVEAKQVTEEKKTSKPSKKNAVVVSFDESDLKNFNTETATLINQQHKNKEKSQLGKRQEAPTEEEQLMRSLFVTADTAEQAEAEFEAQKQTEIETHIDTKVLGKKQVIMQGWGEWAGSGVDNTNHDTRVAKAEEARKRKIEQIKKARNDKDRVGLQLNEERDKKFAQKYLVKELPSQYGSAKQFDTLMSMPLGKDWHTSESYKRMVQPDVLTKVGAVIRPLKYKADLKPQTVEKLVAHRTEKKKAQRTSAKF